MAVLELAGDLLLVLILVFTPLILVFTPLKKLGHKRGWIPARWRDMCPVEVFWEADLNQDHLQITASFKDFCTQSLKLGT